MIETYINLAAACGLKLYSIDLALAGQIKLVRATPELAGKSFVVLQFDGDSLIAGLYEKGAVQILHPQPVVQSPGPRLRAPRSGRSFPV